MRKEEYSGVLEFDKHERGERYIKNGSIFRQTDRTGKNDKRKEREEQPPQGPARYRRVRGEAREDPH
jgi:hypothetical protein